MNALKAKTTVELKDGMAVESVLDNPPNTNPTSMTDLVKEVVNSVIGKNAKYMINSEKTVSVIDIGVKPDHHGTRFRQLVVEANCLNMTVSIKEGFKSVHGGQEQSKTINQFVVPINETEAYGMLQRRFFNYQPNKNLNEGTVLLDVLVKTVKS
jgi:hypothetical protein